MPQEECRLYTRGGDKGETGLYGGKRVPKDSLRVEAYGSIDELNSSLGVAISISRLGDISESLRQIQGLLFVAGADLASSEWGGPADRNQRITREDTSWLEKEIDSIHAKLPRLTAFILPGGTELSAQLHLARSVCRRAERRIVSASRSGETVNPEILPFINRLSTYLFNLARFVNASEGKRDEIWKARES